MNPLDALEKWISEHGSASILRDHLDLLRAQIAQKDALIQDQSRLLKEKEAQIQNLQTQKPADVCPYCRRSTGELEDIRPHPHLGPAGLKVGYYKCSSCGKEYERNMPN